MTWGVGKLKRKSISNIYSFISYMLYSRPVQNQEKYSRKASLLGGRESSVDSKAVGTLPNKSHRSATQAHNMGMFNQGFERIPGPSDRNN